MGKQLLKHREALLAAVIVLLIGAIGSRAPSFVSPGNLVEMFNDTAILIVLALGQMPAQVLGEGFEMLSLVHQVSPPNTSTSLNTQAGEAWPTRITWFGSPLPQ